MQKFEIRTVDGTERLWTNGKRKFSIVKVGNWIPAVFDSASEAYQKVGTCPINFKVFGISQ